jgi:hypothetical protein
MLPTNTVFDAAAANQLFCIKEKIFPPPTYIIHEEILAKKIEKSGVCLLPKVIHQISDPRISVIYQEYMSTFHGSTESFLKFYLNQLVISLGKTILIDHYPQHMQTSENSIKLYSFCPIQISLKCGDFYVRIENLIKSFLASKRNSLTLVPGQSPRIYGLDNNESLNLVRSAGNIQVLNSKFFRSKTVKNEHEYYLELACDKEVRVMPFTLRREGYKAEDYTYSISLSSESPMTLSLMHS